MKSINSDNFKSLQEVFENEKRWVKYHYSNINRTRCCLLAGALLLYSENRVSIVKKLCRTIKKLYPKYYSNIQPNVFSILDFNDDKKTTIKHIRKVVKAAGV